MLFRQIQKYSFLQNTLASAVRRKSLQNLPRFNPSIRHFSSFSAGETSPYERKVDEQNDSDIKSGGELGGELGQSSDFDNMTEDMKSLGYTTGTVKWFDSSKGFGFIIRHDTNSDIFVHFTSIQGSGYRTLEEGQRVQFSVQEGHKGPVAEDVTIELTEF